MAYLIGAGLALAVSLLGRLVGFDRDRAFYPTVTIVIASYYGLFAVMGGSMRALGLESAAMTGFLFTSILGFKLNLWFVVGALFAHGVFDFFHGHLISNSGVVATILPHLRRRGRSVSRLAPPACKNHRQTALTTYSRSDVLILSARDMEAHF